MEHEVARNQGAGQRRGPGRVSGGDAAATPCTDRGVEIRRNE